MKHFGVTKGTRVGVAGIGGLGVMGIKLAKALGCHVTAISRSERKRQIAMDAGADAFVATAEPKQMAGANKSLDLLLNTIAANHDVNTYLPLLAVSGTLVAIGLVPEPWSIYSASLLFGRTGVHGSVIGGIKNTQEVVDLCAASSIYPDIKVVPAKEVCWDRRPPSPPRAQLAASVPWQVNRVFELLDRSNEAGVRYVLDIGQTLTEATFGAVAAADPPEFVPPAQKASTKELRDTLVAIVQPVVFFIFGVVLGMMITMPGTRRE